ncbi:hypothetical protein LH425_12015 [Laribacter hongkongensis]|uniref:hypothetical protein n=1 Tax=Laribacter hongkongensis TaxID=168471 RepID=UPI001EFC5B67|nr:hypothetical protein [Laribacter hongkongensis]MCG9065749.1 hypothetical protein [Laribacter hongkongensis]
MSKLPTQKHILPPRHYYRLNQAADELGCTTDDLVHFGSTKRIELAAATPNGFSAVAINNFSGEIGVPWESPQFLVVPSFALIRVELFGSTTWSSFQIGYEIEGNASKRMQAYKSSFDEVDEAERRKWLFETMVGDTKTPITITAESLFVFTSEIERIKNGVSKDADDMQNDATGDTRSRDWKNRSNKLAIINQAFNKFWANADTDDRTTHPNNADIEKWLIERNYSDTLAKKAATIIRPEWASTGRKPEK